MWTQQTLQGCPRTKLIREVRRWLSLWGISPAKNADVWMATWEWAAAVERSYDPLRISRRPHWPSAMEIATQYVVLLVAYLKERKSLRLPFRAMANVPVKVLPVLGKTIPQLTHEESVSKQGGA
jgi:hypothetical protein